MDGGHEQLETGKDVQQWGGASVKVTQEQLLTVPLGSKIRRVSSKTPLVLQDHHVFPFPIGVQTM